MKRPALPPFVRRSLPWWVVFLLAALMVLPPHLDELRKIQSTWNEKSQPSWIGADPAKAKEGERVYDVDTRLIHGGLVQVETLKDTLRWWHGTWVGQVPFYRPLTSYVFWFQWKAWGEYENRYALVALLLHLAAVFFFTRLAYLLFRHFDLPRPDMGALLVCFIFTRGSPLLHGQAEIVADVYGKWKNEPDALSLAFLSLSLSLYLPPRESSPGNSRVLIWTRGAAPFFYLLTCLTKEAGIFLPLLLPFIEADALRQGGDTRREALRRMAPFFIILVVYLILRPLFLGQVVGYQYGSNGAWVYRLGTTLLGRVSDAVVHLLWAELSLTASLLALGGIALRLRQRPLLALGAIGLLLLLLGSVGAILVYQSSGVPWEIASGLLLILEDPNLSNASISAVILLLTFTIFRRRLWFAAMAYGWVLFALGMTLFSPSVIHRFYLINAGFVLLWVGGALLLAERVWNSIPPLSPAEEPEDYRVQS